MTTICAPFDMPTENTRRGVDAELGLEVVEQLGEELDVVVVRYRRGIPIRADPLSRPEGDTSMNRYFVVMSPKPDKPARSCS